MHPRIVFKGGMLIYFDHCCRVHRPEDLETSLSQGQRRKRYHQVHDDCRWSRLQYFVKELIGNVYQLVGNQRLCEMLRSIHLLED